MSITVSLNTQQQLFVLSTGSSMSCLGFQVLYAQARELTRRLAKAGRKLFEPQESEIGTLGQYEQYQALMKAYTEIQDNKTWFDARTPKKVQSVLEETRKSGDRLRIFLGDPETGRDWLEEFDTIGTIGRSAGTMKVPLLIADGYGGPAILTDCIVRLVNPDTGEELYRHPKYHLPRMELTLAADFDQAEGYTHSVKAESKDGMMETHANFKSQAEAAHWLAFMSGLSHDYHLGD